MIPSEIEESTRPGPYAAGTVRGRARTRPGSHADDLVRGRDHTRPGSHSAGMVRGRVRALPSSCTAGFVRGRDHTRPNSYAAEFAYDRDHGRPSWNAAGFARGRDHTRPGSCLAGIMFGRGRSSGDVPRGDALCLEATCLEVTYLKATGRVRVVPSDRARPASQSRSASCVDIMRLVSKDPAPAKRVSNEAAWAVGIEAAPRTRTNLFVKPRPNQIKRVPPMTPAPRSAMPRTRVFETTKVGGLRANKESRTKQFKNISNCDLRVDEGTHGRRPIDPQPPGAGDPPSCRKIFASSKV